MWRRGREWSEPLLRFRGAPAGGARRQIERGQREGSIRGDIDAAFEAVAVVGMVLTTTLHYIREAEQRVEEGCNRAEAFGGGGALAYRAHLRLRAPRQRVGGGRAALARRRTKPLFLRQRNCCFSALKFAVCWGCLRKELFVYKIYCLNNISPEGLALLTDNYEVIENIDEADAILVRSADMHEMEVPANLKAVARAGAGVNNIPLDKFAEAGIAVFNTPAPTPMR